jgi:hypothetical protein
MYASIRKYKVHSSQEFSRLVNEGFMPIISQSPGFIAYYGVDSGSGIWSSVSIFETKAEADESNRMAADFVKQNLAALIDSGPEITVGDLVVHELA